jgi:cysteine desulfurase
MLANNEVGAIQPVAEIAQVCRERGIHFHCDAVQAAGKIPIDVEQLAIDSLSISGHKFHAPKGVGALYVRAGLTLHAHLAGGAQERRRRAGTENVPLAAALATAATLVDFTEMARVKSLRDRLEERVLAENEAVRVNALQATRVPNTSNLCFSGVDAEGLLIALDLNGVAASTGSACSSGRVEPSHVLLAMGLSLEDARSSLRFSLSRLTTADEIERAAAVIAQHASLHRRMPRAIA